MQVFRLGMSCHAKNRFTPLIKQIEMEKLYKQMSNAKKEGKVTIDNENHLKCELKRYGLSDKVDYSKDLICRAQYSKIK